MLWFCKTFLLFIIISNIGWIIEEIYAVVRNHEKVNRGFLVGPICPIYGICGITFLLLDRFKDNVIMLFLMSLITVCIIEYLISYILEKTLSIKLWDYKKMNFKYQLHGRVALATLIPFGLLGVLVTMYLNPFIYSFVNQLDDNSIYVLSLIIFMIFLVDFVFSVRILKELGKKEEYRDMDVTKLKSSEATKKIRKKVEDTVNLKNKIKKNTK